MNFRSLLALSLCLAASRVSFSADAPGKPAHAISELDTVLAAELEAIYDSDQQGRNQINEVQQKYGFSSPEMLALWQKISAQDAVNLEKVKALLDKQGWLGAETVGTKGNNALFLVIQHADTAVQQKYLPVLRDAVKAKKALPSQLALMEDRVALAEGRRQLYGSQLVTDMRDGHNVVSPMEDPDHVDERRAAMGLGTMAENLQRFNLTWDLAAYKAYLTEAEYVQWGGTPRKEGFDLVLQSEVLTLVLDGRKSWDRFRELVASKGPDAPETTAASRQAQDLNAELAKKAVAFVDAHGWISPGVIGREAAQGLLYLLAAADVAPLQRLLPELRKAALARQADVEAFAYLEDEVALKLRGEQLYGSHFEVDAKSGKALLKPISDPGHLEERRKALFLPPLADYLRRCNVSCEIPNARAEPEKTP